MEIYTAAELRAQIRNVDAQIKSALAVQEYSLSTGQTRQRVTRQALTELRRERAHLHARLYALVYGQVSNLDTGAWC